MAYHVNEKGVAAVCKATKGNCPFGGADSHFSTKEEAQKHAESNLENEYGILGSKGGSGPPKPPTYNVTEKINNNKVLQNLDKIPNVYKRQEAAVAEVKKIMAEKMAAEFKPETNAAYDSYMGYYRQKKPLDHLRAYADNKGYVGRTPEIDEKLYNEGVSKLDKSAEENLKEYKEKLQNSSIYDPATRLNVMIENKKITKRDAKKLVEGGLLENIRSNAYNAVAAWERANEELKKSNIKWEHLRTSDRELKPEDVEKERKKEFFKIYGEVNKGSTIEKIQELDKNK